MELVGRSSSLQKVWRIGEQGKGPHNHKTDKSRTWDLLQDGVKGWRMLLLEEVDETSNGMPDLAGPDPNRSVQKDI